jgi:lycopene cyclase domain-containing protein
LISRYLLLLISLCLLTIPVAASFYSKTPLYKHWKYAGIGLLATVAFFVLWDELFTRLGIWHFNDHYLTGLFVGSLPLEEVLLLICVPFVCMFSYFALNQLVEKDWLFPHQEVISSALIIILLVAGFYHKDKLYTGAAFLLLALFLAFQMLKLRPRYMGKFYTAFLLLLIPLLMAQSLLTGTFIDEPVIHYDDAQNLGIRLGTIPLEAIFFSMLLMVMPITIWEWLEEHFYYKRR